MNVSAPFIARPIGTTLVTIGVALAGILGFVRLPIAPLPQVDIPTISVSASLPGASPDTMAATVAAPLERVLGNIAGVTEITSRSSLGSTGITLQFELDRDIDGAARDVQSAINAARTLLPSGMPSNPTYRKVNPAAAPIMIIALTSDTLTRGQMYDAASTVLAQRLSQVEGVGQVNVGGGALPAVRVELNPDRLAANGIALDSVRQAITATNVNRPKGLVEEGGRSWQIGANDQALTAADYAPILLSYRDGAAVRLRDVATVVDSVQDVRNYGVANGKPAIVLFVLKSPGANIIETVERVREILPHLRASIPAAIDVRVISDRTPTIRASLREVERALAIAIGLVVLVVLLFLRNWRATLLPAIAVPVSLAATGGVMYLCGFSFDNLSAMALTVATGFVVDDAIVVLENITRHIEQGLTPHEAALKGAREIGFTVISISLSLVAVFIPLLLMGGVVGRLFREFAVVLSAAILVSMVVSLTTTPMMAADAAAAPGRTDRPHARAASACARELRPKVLARAATVLSTHPDLDAAPPAGRSGGAARRGGAQRLPLRDDSEDVFPAAGHGCPLGQRAGRSGQLVPDDAGEGGQVHRDRQGRPGGAQRQRLHWRVPAQHGELLHHSEAARGAQALCRCGRGAAARKPRA